MRVLGIDPSIRGTGYGIIESRGASLHVVESGTIHIASTWSQPRALHQIYECIESLVERHQPNEAAIEKIIFVQSIRTAISMGSARGVALAALGKHGLEAVEYPAKSVKSAATGRGGAQKYQVAFMMRALLGLDRTPESDEADALAVALTHIRRIGLPGKHS